LFIRDEFQCVSIASVDLYANSCEFRPDPNGIIGFTVQQLQEAEDIGQRAWIVGHMPPGSPDVLWDQVRFFKKG